MYSNYQSFVSNIKDELFNFKSNGVYNHILEHVSFEQGKQYIYFIQKTIKEKSLGVDFKSINDYLLLNDKYGSPLKYEYNYNDEKIICSPTSLRYILHALLILLHIKSVNLTKIVEVGCGYGGLFLAINHFSKILSISIDKYYIVDLPEVGSLIQNYIKKLENNIDIPYSIHLAYDYGIDILDENLFFISNYCFTEIEELHRNNYINILFPKISNGFIIWQTIFNLPINNIDMIGKNIINLEVEYPQTANEIDKNYYVYF